MAGLLNGLFGKKAEPSPTSAIDDPDFAEFDTETADPSPISRIPVNPADEAAAAPVAGSTPAIPTSAIVRGPYTKWYRVWERTSVTEDFYYELYIIPIIALLVLTHLWGTRTNRRRAHKWFRAHAQILQQEFAVVGFGNRRLPVLDVGPDGETKNLDAATALPEEFDISDDFLKEKASNEFITYATGRLNIAALEVKITLHKRYNPFLWFLDNLLGFFFEAIPSPKESIQAVAFTFDGKEARVVPTPRGEAGEELAEKRGKVPNSTYDGFVWAVVHKDCMRRLRDERYDLSLTTTRDHPKLPEWATVMAESAEITDKLLTPELIKAVEKSEDTLEAFIISDQPIDQPKTLEDTTPIKRVDLLMRFPSSNSSSDKHKDNLPLFRQFLSMPDQLVSTAHFRPEALKKVRQTREEGIRKIKKIDEDEKAEERKMKADKEKKEKRDALLKGMSAEEQRKYLEKEREKDARKAQKKRTMRA